MVVIRLARGGAKKRPFFNIVVADSREARDGRYIERLGYFNPIAKGGETPLFIEQERVSYWISQGAQPSDRVTSLLREFKAKIASENNEKAPEKKVKSAKKESKVNTEKSPKKAAKNTETNQAE